MSGGASHLPADELVKALREDFYEHGDSKIESIIREHEPDADPKLIRKPLWLQADERRAAADALEASQAEKDELRRNGGLYKSWFLPIVRATGEVTDYPEASRKAVDAIGRLEQALRRVQDLKERLDLAHRETRRAEKQLEKIREWADNLGRPGVDYLATRETIQAALTALLDPVQTEGEG